MTTTRRVLYGLAGAALVAVVLFAHWYHRYYEPPRGDKTFLFDWADPHSSVIGYSVSAAGFYLLTAGAIGGRLCSRYWFVYLLAAHILAVALVGGMAVCWEIYQPRRTGFTYDP